VDVGGAGLVRGEDDLTGQPDDRAVVLVDLGDVVVGRARAVVLRLERPDDVLDGLGGGAWTPGGLLAARDRDEAEDVAAEADGELDLLVLERPFDAVDFREIVRVVDQHHHRAALPLEGDPSSSS
jgi:hypothetical protein